MTDYSNILSWGDSRTHYTKFLKSRGSKLKGQKAKGFKTIELKEIDSLSVYALLDSKLGMKPNGFYTSLIQGLPMNSLFWWDFIIESDLGFINIVRTNARLEAQYLVSDSSFDVAEFLQNNIRKYRRAIKTKVKNYEEHRTYINHYQSYRKCLEYLWEEIAQIDLNVDPSKYKPFASRAESDEFLEEMKKFTNNSIKFHALGKSLVLNAAFMCESYINLLIRLGAPSYLNKQQGLLKVHLSSNFETKLKNLHTLSLIIKEPFDMSSVEVKSALDLMTLRNKYVHADESSQHNYLGSVYFDDYYPLMEANSGNPIVEMIESVYHSPSFDKAKWAYETSINFVDFFRNLVGPDNIEDFDFMMNQNPVGFNTGSYKYSVIYPDNSVAFMAISADPPSE